MQVTVKYVNPPREGKTNGSLRLTDGSYLSCPPNLLPLFEGTENTTVDIATRQFKGSSGDMVTMVDSGPGGMRAPAPPRAAQSYVPPKPQGGPVQSALPVSPGPPLAEAKRMFVSNIVANAMNSGKYAPSEIRVLTQAAIEAFEMLSVPPLPKVITPPIETWTNNTRTTPNSEPGDPGPVDLQ